jgi:hypothetical protein
MPLTIDDIRLKLFALDGQQVRVEVRTPIKVGRRWVEEGDILIGGLRVLNDDAFAVNDKTCLMSYVVSVDATDDEGRFRAEIATWDMETLDHHQGCAHDHIDRLSRKIKIVENEIRHRERAAAAREAQVLADDNAQ